MQGNSARLVMVGIVLSASAAFASSTSMRFGFHNITNNDPWDAQIGQDQMVMDVSDYGPSQVLFTFSNLGMESCSITDIYVDDGTLLQINTIYNVNDVVEFSVDPDPSNLPGGGNLIPPFNANLVLSADSDPPPPAMGINIEESLDILYDLQSGGTYQDVLNEIMSSELRVGLHVQGYDSGGSESYVCTPEPGSLLTLLIAGGFLLKRRSQNHQHLSQ
jgi:hypothetical protein